ncbi:hypothetical protein [Thermocatellispora tengchongensis]
MAASLSTSEFGWMYFGSGASCPGSEFYSGEQNPLWDVAAYVPILSYGAVPMVALGFAAHWLGTRVGRARIGRVTARAMAAIALVVHGVGPLAFLVDVAGDRVCLYSEWGGPEGAWFSIGPNVVAVGAALCVFAAVRRPRHRLRALLGRLVRARWVRRTVACGGAGRGGAGTGGRPGFGSHRQGVPAHHSGHAAGAGR